MFNEYPYRNLTDLNLDYILNAIKTFQNDVTNFVSINAIKYANPIQWDITSQYEKNTIVIDPVSGTAYISVAPVPSGVALTREEYWTVVFDLSLFIVRAAKNFTDRYEANTTLTATFPTPEGGWLVWNDTLYRALVNITAGDRYVIGSNIAHFTMETETQNIRNIIGLLTDLDTTDKTNVVAAINEAIDMLSAEAQARQDADGTLQDHIDAEAQARQDADGTLQDHIDAEAQARQDADNAAQTAINKIKETNIPVNILDCGIVGDGSDESTALQAVLDGTYGHYIVIPSGVEIHVYSGVTLGSDPILLEGAGNLSSKIIGHGNIDILTVTTNGAIIKNVGFDYFGGWNTATSGTELKIVAREGYVDNCAFYHYVRAISIDNAIDYKITNCYFAEGNAVQSNIYAHAISIGENAYCTGVHVSNCTILSDDAKSAYSGITIRYADGIDINNILCNRCQYGVILQPTTNVIVHGVVFTNCLFDQCQVVSVDIAPTNGRIQNVKFANCWISTNDISNGTCIAIRPTTAATAQFISFLNCSIMSAATGLLTAGANISDISIIGNTFTEIKGNVLLLNVGSDYVITDNIIDVNVEDSADSYVNGFNIDGIDYLTLAHNISRKATNSDCIVANVAHFKYWQNVFNNSNLYDNEHCAGSTAERPVVKYVGMPYYDTTLAMPIWWNGSNWIDAAGNIKT